MHVLARVDRVGAHADSGPAARACACPRGRSSGRAHARSRAWVSRCACVRTSIRTTTLIDAARVASAVFPCPDPPPPAPRRLAVPICPDAFPGRSPARWLALVLLALSSLLQPVVSPPACLPFTHAFVVLHSPSRCFPVPRPAPVPRTLARPDIAPTQAIRRLLSSFASDPNHSPL